MRKNNMNKILMSSLLALALGFVSCDDQDDATGDSVFEVTEGVVASVTTDFDNSATITLNEYDEEEFPFTITLNKPSSIATRFRIEQIGGDAVLGEDYEILNLSDESIEFLDIPARETTVSGKIKILSDIYVEDTKTLSIQIGNQSLANATMQYEVVNFAIEDYDSSEMIFELNYGKEFYYQGEMTTTCDFEYDMDYLVFDSNFDDTGIYDGATGACPTESLSVSVDPSHPNYLPDGTYYIFYSVWDDGGLSGLYHDVFTIPTSVEFYRPGLLNPLNFDQESAYIPDSTYGSGAEDYVLTIEINSGVISVLDSNNSVLGSARFAVNHDKIKAAFANARAKSLKK